MENAKKGISEDWLAVCIGLFIFIQSLGTFLGLDLLGWGVTTGVWTNLSKALKPSSPNFAGLGGINSLLLTYAALAFIMTVGAALLKADLKKFFVGFSVVFWISYICWMAGSWANIAVTTKPEMKKMGINWSLQLTQESGFIIALLVGLILGNFFPRFVDWIREGIRPEWYIKTAIVILGAFLGVTAAEKLGLASAVMFRGLCAIVEAYLIYWAIVYFIARKYFKFSREWAAPLASGISICGVSAAIATGAAIKARPIVPIMVSSLVVIFAMVELLALPFFAANFLHSQPMVAGAWMGLAVKTDGAAVAAGAVADSLIRAKALAIDGANYQPGWIMATATTVKVFIDVFIGVWSFVLALIWCTVIEKKASERVTARHIWDRFPKFVLGYIVTFGVVMAICIPASKQVASLDSQIASATKQVAAAEAKIAAGSTDAALPQEIAAKKAEIATLKAQQGVPKETLKAAKAGAGGANVFRAIFFTMTFFAIGAVSNFRKLWEEGIGRLAAVYVIALFGFIIWIGLFISWIFFHGVMPPLAS